MTKKANEFLGLRQSGRQKIVGERPVSISVASTEFTGRQTLVQDVVVAERTVLVVCVSEAFQIQPMV